MRAGVFVALQAWTYWFMGHFFAIVFAPALAIWALRGAKSGLRQASPERRGPRIDVLRGLVLAGATAILCVAPAAAPMILGLTRGQIPAGEGLTHTGAGLDPDAWWILAPWASGVHVPVWWLVLLGVALVASRRRALWIPAALLGLLLVAGARLTFAGGSVPNPVWAAAAVLPGFERLLFAARAWPALALVGAAALAEALDRLPARAGSAAAVAAVFATLATHPARLATTDVPVPAYVAAVHDAPGVVLDLPFPCGQLVIPLQPLHGQPMFGGMGEHLAALRPDGVDARIAASPWLQRLIAAGLGQPGVAAPRTRDVRWVVLHHAVYADPLSKLCLPRGVDGAQAARELRALLGAPTIADERASAWDLGAP